MTDDWADLPKAEFAFPGPLRDQLVAAILDGTKISSACLMLEHEIEGTDPFDQVGTRAVMIDSHDRPVAVIETTGIQPCRLADVDLRHAIDEGEGYASVAEWRVGHEGFWHSDQFREYIGDPGFRLTDDTIVVLERFKVVEHL